MNRSFITGMVILAGLVVTFAGTVELAAQNCCPPQRVTLRQRIQQRRAARQCCNNYVSTQCCTPAQAPVADCGCATVVPVQSAPVVAVEAPVANCGCATATCSTCCTAPQTCCQPQTCCPPQRRTRRLARRQNCCTPAPDCCTTGCSQGSYVSTSGCATCGTMQVQPQSTVEPTPSTDANPPKPAGSDDT